MTQSVLPLCWMSCGLTTGHVYMLLLSLTVTMGQEVQTNFNGRSFLYTVCVILFHKSIKLETQRAFSLSVARKSCLPFPQSMEGSPPGGTGDPAAVPVDMGSRSELGCVTTQNPLMADEPAVVPVPAPGRVRLDFVLVGWSGSNCHLPCSLSVHQCV